MKNLCIALCAALTVTAACSSEPQFAVEPLRSVVACDFVGVEDSAFHAVRLHYSTPFEACQETYPIAWPQLSFTASCNLFAPQQVMLATDEQHSLSFLVYPGDSVHLAVDCAALKAGRAGEAVRFSGGHARLNAEVQPWTARIYPSLYRTWDEGLTGDALTAQFTSAWEALSDSLERYAAASGMSREAREWAARDLKFALSSTLPPVTRGQQSNFYARDFFDLTCPANFSSMMFMSHLKAYVSTVMTDARSRLGRSFTPARLAQEMVGTMAALPEGPVRDAAFYIFVSGIVSGGNRDALYEAVPDIEDHIGLDAVRELLASVYRQYLYSVSDDVPVESALHFRDGQVEEVRPDTLFAAWLSRRHPGQVVCMELGTAWCEACAYEQESLPALRRALGADSSRLVAVSCCVDSELDAWQTMAAGSPGVEHFYFSPETARAASAKFNIETYPVYLLVDESGQLHEMPCPSHLEEAAEAVRAVL